MPSTICSGSISFGLVNIPVSLVTAEQRDDLDFTLLDKREMTEEWDPTKYHDEYRDELLAFIRKRRRAGQTTSAPEPEAEPATRKRADIIDIAELLKRSLARTGEDRRRLRRRKSA